MINLINNKISKIFFGVFVIATLFLVTGCSKQNVPPKDQHQTIGQSNNSVDSTLIRDKNIDVTTIDKNKDGRVYQCQMDYDVISDKPGVCPKCGMKLIEVPVKQAQENLKQSSM